MMITLTGSVHAFGPYHVLCQGVPDGATSINSVFGESRQDSGYSYPNRFHAGVDIDDTNCGTDGNTVQAIEAGTATLPPLPSCTGNCVRITDASGHAFDYVDITVVSTITTGSQIAAGQTIGVINGGSPGSEGPHLHLNEIQGMGVNPNCGSSSPQPNCFRVNPQRPNGMVFTDSDLPEFVTQDIGGTYAKVVLVPHLPSTEGGANPPVPFNDVDNIVFVSGQVDILATANSGMARKGLYQVGAFIQDVGYLFQQKGNITLNTLQDARASETDVQNIYFSQNGTSSNGSNTFFATNFLINNVSGYQTRVQTWNTTAEQQGQTTLCGSAKNYPQGFYAEECFPVFIDNTPPTMTFEDTSDTPWPNQTATSSNTIVVAGSDTGSGVHTINVDNIGFGGSYNETSTNTAPGPDAPAYSATFPFSGTLSDGQYSAKVCDLADNCTSVIFSIDTTLPSAEIESSNGNVLGSTVTSMNCVVAKGTSSFAGIDTITISGPMGFGSFTYHLHCSTEAEVGAFCQVPTGNYAVTVLNCAGKSAARGFYYDNSFSVNYILEATGSSFGVKTTSGTFSLGKLRTDPMTLNSRGGDICLQVSPSAGSCHSTPNGLISGLTVTPSASSNLTVTNSTNASVTSGIAAELWLDAESIYAEVASLNFPYSGTTPFAQNDTIAMVATIAEVGQKHPKSSGTASAYPPFSRPTITSPSASCNPLLGHALWQSLGVSGECAAYFASDFIFTSSAPIQFQYTDATVDTTTLRIYGWTGTSWSSAAVADQTTSRNGSNVVTSSGNTSYSGYYVPLYQAHDSSAPITAFSIQGSSFNFDGALFVSTDAYAVLVATDPVVSGFASTVASVTYRIDPSPDSPFIIYSSSIPLSLGTHVFEYRSLDYAGNPEAIKTSTFTVTAGTAFRAPNTAQVPGNLLNGFLGSGAKLEIESQAQDAMTLLISSVNRQGMVAVDNIGEVGIGVTPQANLNIGQGSIGLQLRSGNSTSSLTSNQIAFGYNGDASMRHLLRTEHSTSTDGNKMDFLVWNTGAGSTTAVAGLNVLSLQGIATASGGSFHVQPVGEPDAEVEVSNGLNTGGGTMQRLQVVSPSSRRFKTDIKDLSEKDEDRALADVAGLKHATFRYKTLRKDGSLIGDSAQPLRTGLIYEEAPESIRDGAEALSTTERLVNVEMALKAAMRRLEDLQGRYERLKARRKP